MTGQLGVSYTADADKAGAIGQVIASLPVSLRPASAAPDLVGIDGAPGWVQAALASIEAGARGLVVVNPVDENTAALRNRADDDGVPVVIDGVWTYSPAVAQGAAAFREADDGQALLEVRVDAPTASDLGRVLLGQLALVRALASPVIGLSTVRWNAHGFDLLASLASGARASLAAIATDALPHSARLRSVKETTAVELVLPSPASASPGTAVATGPDGATLLVTAYETAHRAAWRRLHELVQAGGRTDDLAAFAEDAATARTARLHSE